MIKVEWGKSMYGGWYAQWMDISGKWDGINADTKKALTEKLNGILDDWSYGRRYDND